MSRQQPYGHYALMARFFGYPSATLKEDAKAAETMLKATCPDAATEFKRFADWVAETDIHEMEEVFAKTFHVQAICYLDLGYVIFGEDYKRGEFLVNMQREQATANNDCGEELPDNLMNMLTLLPMLKDDTFRDELAGRVMIPALRKMLKEFDSARMRMREKMLRKKHSALIMEGQAHGNIYRNALQALLLLMKNDFNEIALVDTTPESDPLRAPAPVDSCGTCSVSHTPVNTQRS